MAFLRKRGQTYSLRWRDAFGKTQEASLGDVSRDLAKQLRDEKAAQVIRQRLGLEPAPASSSETLGQLCRWWLKEVCPPAARREEEWHLGKHVIGKPLGAVQLRRLGPEHVIARMRDMVTVEQLAPATANKLRTILSAVFSSARRARRWFGPNPLEDVPALRVPRRVYETLRPDELPRLLASIPPQWRDFFAAAVFTGMRKGELCGLQKADLDWTRRQIAVRRSYAKETTKGGHGDVLPMAGDLVPFLEHALDVAGDGPYVFPGRRGRMRTRESDPHLVLQHALGRAGIVTGWEHSCRRCKSRGEGHVERAQDDKPRHCPSCGMKLWVKPVPRAIRFHDLRHSIATLLLAAGVPMQHVQRICRHAKVTTTVDLYGHMVVEDLREAIEVVGERAGRGRQRSPASAAAEGVPIPPAFPPPSDWALQVSNLRPPPCESEPLPSRKSSDRANPATFKQRA